MWETSVFVAIQEGGAVDWVIKDSSISFWQGKRFPSSLELRTSEANQPPLQSVLRVIWLGQETNS
jgi:hypothetical protein